MLYCTLPILTILNARLPSRTDMAVCHGFGLFAIGTRLTSLARARFLGR